METKARCMITETKPSICSKYSALQPGNQEPLMMLCMKHRTGRSAATASFGLPPWKYSVLDQHPFGMGRKKSGVL